MKPQKQKLVVLGMVQNDAGQILINQRIDPQVPAAHLKWDIPGGTNEFGESLEETLVREMLEEANIKVEVVSLLPQSVSKFWEHVDYHQHTLLFCFRCRFLEGEIKTSDEKIQNLQWISLEDSKNFDFLPTTQIFIDHILEELKV